MTTNRTLCHQIEASYLLPNPGGPAFREVAEELLTTRKILASLVESYDILTTQSPLRFNSLAVDVCRGAFIGTIDEARKCLGEDLVKDEESQ